MLAKDALDNDADVGTSLLAELPVYGDATSDRFDKLGGDEFEFIIAHDDACTGIVR